MLHAVDGVDLKIMRGRTLGVVGESGCGKSTLGRTILRLIPHTSGDVRYGGESIVGYGKSKMREMRRHMQIIFQDPYSSINPRMTVSQIISEFMIVNRTYPTRREIDDRTAELMDTVGLASRLTDAYPHELDGGRRQRIGIARALSLDPSFIVCDEPVSALDVSIQAQILNLLMDLQDERELTYMFITHNLSVVKHISDDIAVMYLGKCVELAPSKELFSNPLHPYTKALIAAIPEPRLDACLRDSDIIRGEVTSPIDPPAGCRFAARCDYCTPACTERDQEFRDMGDGHFVACTLMDG
ncbi:ATP-binding cassette domain-containing protein [Synergistaceae bacterium OttesenSCG-928-I11]|nr:ATP-binding cassette domain-containing protein [Synergistaceae bacterium OttesenSCG-928-I11]